MADAAPVGGTADPHRLRLGLPLPLRLRLRLRCLVSSSSPSWPGSGAGTVPAITDGYIDRLDRSPTWRRCYALAPWSRWSASRDGGPGAERDRLGTGPGRLDPRRDWPLGRRARPSSPFPGRVAVALGRAGPAASGSMPSEPGLGAVRLRAAATALVAGRAQVSRCESTAAQFLSWLAGTGRPWLVDPRRSADDEADLDGLGPASPAGRVLVTCADAAAVPRGVRRLPIGPFDTSARRSSYLTERLGRTGAAGWARST